MAGTDFSHLTTDELIKGIKALDLPDYIRSKAYGIDVRETLAQMTEMTIQLGVNMGLSPDEALKWARKLQESVSQSEFDSWVATLLDGGPSIFMNTLNELKTTYPNGAAGVALVRETDPAKIYVWNGTDWEDFGAYQGIEVKDGTITPEKTNFTKRYKNIFDGNFVRGVIIGGDSTAGYKYASYTGGVSLIVEIEPNQTYTISRSVDTNRFGIGVFEGKPNVVINAKRMLNASQNSSLGTFTFTAGATETHLMVYLSSANETPSWVQIEKGEFATEFVGYGKLDIDVAIKNENIVEPIKKENTTVVEKYNLLNKDNFIDEKILDSTGKLLDFPDYSTSTKQFIEKGSYFVSAHRRLVTFNTDGVFIKQYDNTGHSEVTVDIPEDCFYQISCRDEHWDDLRVVRKDYGQLPDNTMLLARDIFIPQQSQSGYNQRFSRKNIIFFGDSILRNYPDDGSIPHIIGERLGCNVTNVAIGGTKIAYIADSNNTPLSGSKLLEDKINNDLSEQFTVADTQSGVQKERTLSSLNGLNSNSLDYYDFGVIAYTTNDFLQSIPEGNFDKDRSTIKGAYSYFIENLLTFAPAMKLLLVSPTYQWRPDDLSFDIDEYTNNSGLKMADIVRIIEEVADHYKLEFLDNFNNAGLNDFNRQYYYPSNDGIHPLASTGIPILANRIAGKLEDIF